VQAGVLFVSGFGWVESGKRSDLPNNNLGILGMAMV